MSKLSLDQNIGLCPESVSTGETNGYVGREDQLHREIQHRFGVVPNFFRLTPDTPEVTANLWGFARSAYLDNPLPSLFKERLFVYLSRFCDVRYCITRHAGFLLGLGRPAGDDQCPVQTVEDVIQLIRRPLPRAEHLEPYLSQCTAYEQPLSVLPNPGSALEEALFACATHAFLQTSDAPTCLDALNHVLGSSRFQHLITFLAFVRTAHYWTKVHTGLSLDEDLQQLLIIHEALAECLLNDPEAGTYEISQKLLDELTVLRRDKERHEETLRVHQALQEHEEQLRYINAELSQRVTDLQQANAALQDARRAALNVMEDAVHAREALARQATELHRINAEFQQFAYIISHDLNEPLRTMRNFVQLLASRTGEQLGGEASEFMAFVTDAAQRMQQMLSDLLAYTRAGQMPTFQAVDCEALFLRVIEALQLQIEECGATVSHDPLPTVQGDPTRLGQVFQNLIGNALKFHGHAPPCIHVSALREGDHWQFAVRDNGIGIDPVQAGRLFQVFQRLHARGDYPGTGIGLAICKRIVEQHGGRIWVESRPSAGAVFYFTIGENSRR